MTDNEGFARIDETTFPEQLRLARKRLSVSQEALTEELAKRGYPVHVTAVGKIERNERKVTIGEAAAIADALGVSLDSMIGGQSSLQSAYAKHNEARRSFGRNVEAYSLALLDVAVAADSAADLRPVDIEWLSDSFVEQTPAQMTSDASMILEAAIARESIDRGQYVAMLLDAVGKDAAQLGTEAPPTQMFADIDPEIRWTGA